VLEVNLAKEGFAVLTADWTMDYLIEKVKNNLK